MVEKQQAELEIQKLKEELETHKSRIREIISAIVEIKASIIKKNRGRQIIPIKTRVGIFEMIQNGRDGKLLSLRDIAKHFNISQSAIYRLRQVEKHPLMVEWVEAGGDEFDKVGFSKWVETWKLKTGIHEG
ncbi:hypothetical protein [Parasegetibacter sp. NRK P23]|uniref:hypothetical protein n=1 Tax=Parasegetibacter sp. NRK P23 TaxID=2942999 RepID=UPI0020437290|nr:hypothetical protein [Parasegetibacter sp. NRK P23]MCM5528951.1 hypothetical protein [Parasegetibacter sp. NRK P23]